MKKKKLYTPNLHEQNVRKLYRVSQKFGWTMSKMLNHIVAVSLEQLEAVDPDEFEIVYSVRPEQFDVKGGNGVST